MSDKLFANIAPAAPEKEKPAPKSAASKDKVDATKEAPATTPAPEAPKAPEPVKQEAAPVEDAVPSAPDEVEDIEETKVDKLSVMKMRADVMGIAYKPDVTADYLEAMIDMALAAKDKPAETQAPVVQAPVVGQAAPVSAAATKSLRQHVYEEGMKLIRIRLTNMDQKDQNLNGDIFTVSNEFLGDVKRFVPYQDKFYENGYHVENCILKQLQDKKYLRITVTKNSQKQEVISSAWVKKFNIEILPPLTEAEIERLRIAQLQSGSTLDD